MPQQRYPLAIGSPRGKNASYVYFCRPDSQTSMGVYNAASPNAIGGWVELSPAGNQPNSQMWAFAFTPNSGSPYCFQIEFALGAAGAESPVISVPMSQPTPTYNQHFVVLPFPVLVTGLRLSYRLLGTNNDGVSGYCKAALLQQTPTYFDTWTL